MVFRNMDSVDSSVNLNFKGKAKGLFRGKKNKPGKNISRKNKAMDKDVNVETSYEFEFPAAAVWDLIARFNTTRLSLFCSKEPLE